MAKTNYQSVDEYLQGFSGEALSRLNKVRDIIRQLVPEAEEVISYQIPCYKYKGYLIYFCGFPKHISLSYPYSTAFWEHFANDLTDKKTSKSVIQLPLDEYFPEDLIRRIVQFRKDENDKAPLKKKWKIIKV